MKFFIKFKRLFLHVLGSFPTLCQSLKTSNICMKKVHLKLFFIRLEKDSDNLLQRMSFM